LSIQLDSLERRVSLAINQTHKHTQTDTSIINQKIFSKTNHEYMRAAEKTVFAYLGVENDAYE